MSKMAPGASVRAWLLAAAGPVAEFLLVYFVIGYALAPLASHLAEGQSAQPTVYSAAFLAASLAYVTWRLGPTRNPWIWGEFGKRKAFMSVLVIGAVMLGAAGRLGVIPGRLLELRNMADYPQAWTVYVLAPLSEELLCRGLLLRRLSDRLGFWPALVISSLLFAVFHEHRLAAFLIGLWLGYLYSPRGVGNLLVPMLLHSFHNLAALRTW